MSDEAEVSQPLLLLGDEEWVVRGVAEPFEALADGTETATGVAGLHSDAECFTDAVDEDAAGERALIAAGVAVGVAAGAPPTGLGKTQSRPVLVNGWAVRVSLVRNGGCEAGCVEAAES